MASARWNEVGMPHLDNLTFGVRTRKFHAQIVRVERLLPACPLALLFDVIQAHTFLGGRNIAVFVASTGAVERPLGSLNPASSSNLRAWAPSGVLLRTRTPKCFARAVI